MHSYAPKRRRRRRLPGVLLAVVALALAVTWLCRNFGGADSDRWALILVNPWHTMPEDYAPALTQLSNGQSVDSRIYPDLQQMFDTARSQGVDPVVYSGYRTWDKQQSLLDAQVASYLEQGYSPEQAQEAAQSWVAVPGTSEHQLGLAVDINANPDNSTDEEVYAWLAENAWQFGFILRYPQDKTQITGIQYEPWHYRYVGREAAAHIHTSGQCLEEYLGG